MYVMIQMEISVIPVCLITYHQIFRQIFVNAKWMGVNNVKLRAVYSVKIVYQTTLNKTIPLIVFVVSWIAKIVI